MFGKRGKCGFNKEKNMKTNELVAVLGIEKEVSAFVIGRVKEITTENRKTFSFEGSRRGCGCEGVHVPHVDGHYNTVRYGQLENYCAGKEGEIDDKRLVIVVEKSSAGSPETPGWMKGFYFFK
jgi:hypothetical protein